MEKELTPKQIYQKEYRKNNKERIKASKSKYNKENSDSITAKRRAYQKEYRKAYYAKNKENEKQYTKDNQDYYKQWHLDNKESRRKYFAEYRKNKKATNPLFKLHCNIQNLISNSLRNTGNKKNDRTLSILGCDVNQFKAHLEAQWESWMNWDNYGLYNGQEGFGWDIDHITPTSSAKTEDEVIVLNHFTNLRPLCSKINRYVKRGFITQ